MNSRIRIVKRNGTSGPEPASIDTKTREVLRSRETVAVVKSWIDEFKLRSRQAPRVTLPLINKA